jgi:arylsulfatase A
MNLPHFPLHATPHNASGEVDPRPLRAFRDMVFYVDELVGRIAAHLDALELSADTLLIFTSDNGSDDDLVTSWRGRRLRGGKGQMNRNGAHPPLVVRWPGQVEAGAVSRQIIDFSDLLPTLVEVSGAALPAAPVDGVSFAPGLRGEARDDERHAAFVQMGSRYFARDRRWKLHNDGRLYDVERDFDEIHALGESAAHPATPESSEARLRLTAHLESLRTSEDWRRWRSRSFPGVA